jgi:hypothetical protein
MSGARKSGVEMSTKAPLLGGHAAAPAESSHGDGEIHGKPKFSDQQASEDKAMVEQVRQAPLRRWLGGGGGLVAVLQLAAEHRTRVGWSTACETPHPRGLASGDRALLV